MYSNHTYMIGGIVVSKGYYCKKYEEVEAILSKDNISREDAVMINKLLTECLDDVIIHAGLTDEQKKSFRMTKYTIHCNDDFMMDEMFDYQYKVACWLEDWMSECNAVKVKYLSDRTKLYLKNN